MRHNFFSVENTTLTPLASGATFTGGWEQVQSHASVVVALKTDQAGTLYMEFSIDGINADSSLSFSVAANTNEIHRLSVTRPLFRVRFTNTSGSDQTYLRLGSTFSNATALTSALNSTIQTDADSLVTRSILYGQTPNGDFVSVPVTPEGHLEAAIHSPRGAFGEVITTHATPVFQSDAVYQISANQQTTTASGSGAVSVSDSAFVCSSGTTIYSQASLQSRKRLRYRPGQGVLGRFTALFTTPVASSYQVVGFGHAEDGLFVGYKNTDFGILHSIRGKREIRTLTISTKSSTAENATVTLNGTAFSVAVTNGASTVTTANEVANGTYTGWKAEAVGSTVIFVADAVGAKSGTYSIAGTSVVGSFAQTSAGQAATETFITQAQMNGDPLDGTGPSGFTIDPTKLNVFQVKIQYLGAGVLVVECEVPAEGNNADFVVMHSFNFPNTRTTSNFGNPSFPFTMATYSAGSTTDLTVKSCSYAGFIEGDQMLHGSRVSYTNQLTTVGAVNYQVLFSIRNSRVFQGRANQSVIKLLSVSGAIKHTSPVIYYLVRNATLTAPNWASYSSNSCSYYDTTATTCTFANADLIWSGHLGDTGELDHHFNGGSEEIDLQPGETITLCAKATTGSPSWVTGSLNTREDK